MLENNIGVFSALLDYLTAIFTLFIILEQSYGSNSFYKMSHFKTYFKLRKILIFSVFITPRIVVFG